MSHQEFREIEVLDEEEFGELMSRAAQVAAENEKESRKKKVSSPPPSPIMNFINKGLDWLFK